jgi:hypothetical protein
MGETVYALCAATSALCAGSCSTDTGAATPGCCSEHVYVSWAWL